MMYCANPPPKTKNWPA